MKDDATQVEPIDVLRKVPTFQALDKDVLEKIKARAEHLEIARGTVLIEEGAHATALYIVVRGRFTVIAHGEAIAEVATGEPIGELAFFAGGTRTATVIAARDSSVMRLTRDVYDTLSAETPALTNGILAAVSQRLVRAVPVSPRLRPEAGRVTAVFPAAGGTLSPSFVTRLETACAAHDGWCVLRASDRDLETDRDHAATRAWLDQKEAEHGHLILLCPDPGECAAWRKATANNCDTIVLVHDRRGAFSQSDAPSDLERDIFGSTLPPNIHYVLARQSADAPTQGTAAFLQGRSVGLHHHVALDTPADFARLARFLAGAAVGLVLCGGGSYGTAHLGAIKALQERGHAFDFVGGTSVGSAMAGALSMGLRPDDIMEQCEDIFLRSKAMSRLTVPRYSLLDHHTLDAAFKKHYGAYDVEDLPINFFAISTSLTCNDVSIIRAGPLWQAIRASTAIPGIFPPFLRDDGEVLIDGGLIDNVPLDAMRDLKPGPNVVLNFLPGKPWTVDAKYDDLPTRIEALGGLFRKPQKDAPRHPTAFTVLARAMVVNARKLLASIDVGTDVLLNIAVLQGMSFMNWKRGRELYESAYAQMNIALTQTQASDADRMEQLRAASVLVNAAADEMVDQLRRDTSTDPTE